MVGLQINYVLGNHATPAVVHNPYVDAADGWPLSKTNHVSEQQPQGQTVANWQTHSGNAKNHCGYHCSIQGCKWQTTIQGEQETEIDTASYLMFWFQISNGFLSQQRGERYVDFFRHPDKLKKLLSPNHGMFVWLVFIYRYSSGLPTKAVPSSLCPTCGSNCQTYATGSINMEHTSYLTQMKIQYQKQQYLARG